MDKLENDTTFFLRSFFYKQEQSSEDYKAFQKEIRDNGFQIITSNNYEVKVYHPALCLFFISRDLPVREYYTKIETKINGYDYLQTYIEGYKEGEQYFETEFKVSPNTLYGENAEDYVKAIHHNFFHTPIGESDKGWVFVKDKFSYSQTHKSVKRHGYYSGIVAKVEGQIEKHPRLFKIFESCEHGSPSLQSQIKKTAPPPKALKTLEELFKEKFGTDKEYQDFKENLFSKNPKEKKLLSEDLSTWIGTRENGKMQLASVIKYAGQNFLQRNLSEKEVIFISVKDFNNKVSEGTAKKGKYENAEYYFI